MVYSVKDFLVETRSNFPSDKVTLNISDLTRDRFILWFNIFFKVNGKHHLDLLLEDSAREFGLNFIRLRNILDLPRDGSLISKVRKET